MADVNIQFLISMGIIFLGYLLKRLNILKKSDGDALARIVLNVTLPALILTTIPHINLDRTLILLPFIDLAYAGLILVFAYFLFRRNERPQHGLLMICSPGFNIGLFAYPFILAIYGNEGLQYVAMFDVGNAIVIFFISYALAVAYSPVQKNANWKYILKKVATFIPLLSYVFAMLFNVFNVEFHVNVTSFLEILAKANSPLVLLILGLFLDFQLPKETIKQMFQLLGIRYFFGIIVGFLCYFFLPFSLLLRTILLIAFILPIGMAVLPYSVEFGYDEKLAGATVNLSNILSFSLMWIIMAFFPIIT
jgi:predicted permease